MSTACADALVLFGGTGDLARKKIHPALQAMTRKSALPVPVVVVARDALSTDGLRARVRTRLAAPGTVDEVAFARLAPRLAYVAGDYREASTYAALRAGKHLPVTATEVVAELRSPPQQVFGEPAAPAANDLRFRLGPDRVAIALGVRTKHPGVELVGRDTELHFCDEAGAATDAYERLLCDALRGDGTLFAREDAVEAARRIVEPALAADEPAHVHEPGSWGPAQAEALTAACGGWRAPA